MSYGQSGGSILRLKEGVRKFRMSQGPLESWMEFGRLGPSEGCREEEGSQQDS